MPRACAEAAPFSSPAGKAPRHLRQEHGADGDADDADGKLIDAVGVIERRERAGGQERGDQRVGEERKLHAARADDGGPKRLQELPRGQVEARHAEPQAEMMELGVDRHQDHLHDARGEHAPGGGIAGVGEPGRRAGAR